MNQWPESAWPVQAQNPEHLNFQGKEAGSLDFCVLSGIQGSWHFWGSERHSPMPTGFTAMWDTPINWWTTIGLDTELHPVATWDRSSGHWPCVSSARTPVEPLSWLAQVVGTLEPEECNFMQIKPFSTSRSLVWAAKNSYFSSTLGTPWTSTSSYEQQEVWLSSYTNNSWLLLLLYHLIVNNILESLSPFWKQKLILVYKIFSRLHSCNFSLSNAIKCS